MKRRTQRLRAKSECEIAEISYAKFQEISETHPEFLARSQMVCRLRATTRKVGDLSLLMSPAASRAPCSTLCKEPDAATHPDGMQIKITRQEIGCIVGCSCEMVAAALKTLKIRVW